MRERVWILASFLAVMSAVLAITVAVRADIARRLLHEFIPVDAREDVEFSATTADGTMPAAIETPSGVVAAPDTTRQPTATEKSYGGTGATTNIDNVFTPDLDTRRPNVSRYDDPFSPATAPYKRLRAFDAVREDFTMTVADSGPRNVPVGGAALSSEDSFFGDMTVDVVPGEGVLIPTVGPGARLIKLVTVPPVGVTITADSADNWYARANVRARIRLVQWLAIPREAFGGPLREMPVSHLRGARPVPDNVRRAALEVTRAIGVTPNGTVREVVGQLVEWFRSFQPSEEPPQGRGNQYLDLALSKKGVCRHRAYAFVVTALALGIPSRLVVNESHAWVEVFDGVLWRRIDLGGAAANIEQDPLEGRPAHRPPADPFPWPSSNDSGEESARRTRAEQQPSGPGDAGASPFGTWGPTGNGPQPGPSPGIPAALSKVVVLTNDGKVMRGSPMRVEGTVTGVQGVCGHVRVDVALLDARSSREWSIGSLSTDERGRYEGAVVMPLEIPVGDYELVVTTPGDVGCGAGRSGG
jgi:hypothetical protein